MKFLTSRPHDAGAESRELVLHVASTADRVSGNSSVESAATSFCTNNPANSASFGAGSSDGALLSPRGRNTRRSPSQKHPPNGPGSDTRAARARRGLLPRVSTTAAVASNPGADPVRRAAGIIRLARALGELRLALRHHINKRRVRRVPPVARALGLVEARVLRSARCGGAAARGETCGLAQHPRAASFWLSASCGPRWCALWPLALDFAIARNAQLYIERLAGMQRLLWHRYGRVAQAQFSSWAS